MSTPSPSTPPVSRSAAGLAYRRGGTGRGPAVVLLHGIPGGAVTWQSVADALMVDHDVVVPDLLGFGASDRPSGLDELHVEAQAVALLALLHELELPSVVLVGHDFGAPTAVTVARLAPARVAGLGILSGNFFTDTPIPFPLSTITWPALGAFAEHLLAGGIAQRMLLRAAVGVPKVELDTGAHLGDARQRRAVRLLLAGSLRRLGTLYAPVEEHLGRLTVPRFVAWGDRDPLFPIVEGERAADALRVPLIRLTGAGHFLPQERPIDVIRLVRFLVADVASDVGG